MVSLYYLLHSDGVPPLGQSFNSLASFHLGQPFKIIVQLNSSLRRFSSICFISQNNHILETDTDSLEKSSSILDFMLQITQQCSRTFTRNLITHYFISLVNSFHSHSLFSLNSYVLSNPSILTRILAYSTTHSLLSTLVFIQLHCHSLIPILTIHSTSFISDSLLSTLLHIQYSTPNYSPIFKRLHSG